MRLSVNIFKSSVSCSMSTKSPTTNVIKFSTMEPVFFSNTSYDAAKHARHLIALKDLQ